MNKTLWKQKEISKYKAKNQATIEHEIGSLKKGQSPYKILDFDKRRKSSLMKTTLMSGLLNVKYQTHNTLSG